MILGTAAYMAPEQARGKAVDKRADIWAFGVVFLEMITGRRAFDGDDLSTIIAAVIRAEPGWDGVPARARHLLESCLEKDPRKRCAISAMSGNCWTPAGSPPPPPPRSVGAGWIAAGALGIVARVASW